MKTLYVIIFLLAVWQIICNPVASATIFDMEIACDNQLKSCTYAGDSPLFSGSDGLWYPGKSVSKNIKVTNSGNETGQFALSAIPTSTTHEVDRALLVSIISPDNNTILWGGTLKDMFDKKSILLNSSRPHEETAYKINVSMKNTSNIEDGKDNEYQNIEITFDINIGFWEEDVVQKKNETDKAVTPVLTPTSGCTDEPPRTPPVIAKIVPTYNSAIINWKEGEGPISYYIISYGINPINDTYQNSTVGGKGTTEYTIIGLSADETYCFKVQAGNGCRIGLASSPQCAKIKGAEKYITPAVGFEKKSTGGKAEVLGAKTGITDKPTVSSTIPTISWIVVLVIIVGFVFSFFI